MDILIALVEQSSEVVNHRELISRAWRGLVVESGNLRVQVLSLRRCLGDGKDGARYIANLPGLGYSFVASVRPVSFDQVMEATGTGQVTQPRIRQKHRPRVG